MWVPLAKDAFHFLKDSENQNSMVLHKHVHGGGILSGDFRSICLPFAKSVSGRGFQHHEKDRIHKSTATKMWELEICMARSEEGALEISIHNGLCRESHHGRRS